MRLPASSRAWFDRVRRRALAWTLGIALTAIALIAWTTIPAWPVVGVAFAAAALVVNTAAARLKADRPLCLSCGHDLSGVATGQYGRVCPSCGGINQPYMVDAVNERPRA